MGLRQEHDSIRSSKDSLSVVPFKEKREHGALGME